jgi:hypothetical protein
VIKQLLEPPQGSVRRKQESAFAVDRRAGERSEKNQRPLIQIVAFGHHDLG